MFTNFIKSLTELVVKPFRFIFDLLTGKHAEEKAKDMETKKAQFRKTRELFESHLETKLKPALETCSGSGKDLIVAICDNRVIEGIDLDDQISFMNDNRSFVESELISFTDQFRHSELTLHHLAHVIYTMLSSEENAS